MEISRNLYDVIIIGGPAGLSSAVYAARARYRVLVLEKEKVGGQITITSESVNYPGVESTDGTALTQVMKRQAESFGAEFAVAEVLDAELEGDVKILHTTAGDYEALGVVLATGANPRKLGFKGEKEFQGRGVAYCATCDGEFFTGLEVFVIGGGFAAVEDGLFLTKYAKKVTLVVRGDHFTCAAAVSDKLEGHPKIEVKFNTELTEAGGESMVSYARFKNNKTGEEWEYRAPEEDGCMGIFVFAGYVPNTGWLGGKVACDGQGYLITDRNQKTSVDGVYGAGDVCIKNLRQVVTAVADGAVAATSLEKHVAEIHSRLQIPELAAGRKAPSEDSAGSKSAGRSGGPAGGAGAGAGENGDAGNGQGFLSGEIKAQLVALFLKFQNPVIVEAELDESPLSGELAGFVGELDGLTDKLICRVRELDAKEREGRAARGELSPSLRLYRSDGSGGNILFHGVPGGHEFNSFVIALYNLAGPGQPVDEEIRSRIEKIEKDINVKVMVSLSCTMCPEVVMAAQRAASLNGRITAEMADLAHYPEWKQKYHIMSVPCMILDGEKVAFGKKNLAEVSRILAEHVEN